MSTAPVAMAAFDPASTLGALLIGSLLSCLLWGIGAVQAYVYYSRYPRDSLLLKAGVAFVCLCETVQIACVVHTLYSWLVLDYGRPQSLDSRPPRSVPAFVFLAVLISVSVRLLFAERIHALSKSTLVPSLTTALSAAHLAAGCVMFAVGLSQDSLAQYVAQYNKLALAIWGLSVGQDFVISAALMNLWGKKGMRRRTTSWWDVVILWTVETGVLTGVCSLALLICFRVMRSNFVWVALFSLQVRLLANCLFAHLNGRPSHRSLSLGASSSAEPIGTNMTVRAAFILTSRLLTAILASQFASVHSPIPTSTGLPLSMDLGPELELEDIPEKV
ncbi:hypothetical protein HMN09_00471700 [Mycena chlorophos]|uniref:DUF6534 domain-containing protein n=1 Tax=Mycena chlorophos TaxID=658473 RepID=A0A8H6TH06_MYCCL|nr:hypothetical protein HMN09_00471700 [Mycena chlorophos]